jgi:hypothetical protein
MSTTPPASSPEAHGLARYVWSRKALLFLLVAALSLALGVGIYQKLQSGMDPPKTTFVARVEPVGVEGDFEAVTTARGERSAVAACTVTALDIYGHALGERAYDLGRLQPGEPLAWRGHIRVEGRVERMSIVCP